MKESILACAVSAALLGAAFFVGSAQAAPRLCDDGTRPPCRDTGEATPTNVAHEPPGRRPPGTRGSVA